MPGDGPLVPDGMVETLRRDIGFATPWRTITVAPEEVHRFRSALDPAERETSPASDAEAPPTFFCPDPIILSQALGWARHRPFPNTLDGGTRWEWHRALRAGDTVRLRAEITDVSEKMGSAQTGRMFLTTILVTCAALSGDVIARCWGTSISYQGAS